MDPNRDNPIVRFTTFWWMFWTFMAFALLLGIFALINRDKAADIEAEIAKARYAVRAEVDAAQAAELPQEKIEAAIPVAASQLLSAKPTAVETPEQVVPGSPTSEKLAAAPATDFSAIDSSNEPVDPAVMESAKVHFMICAACHGQNGEGGPVGPPLAGSDIVTGPISNLIRIQLRGLEGPITVSGKEYNFPVGMAALSYQTDEQIAAVLTYIRNSFGNTASAVKPEHVTSLRSEVGKPPLKFEDLVKP